jgi:hypothetical protein
MKKKKIFFFIFLTIVLWCLCFSQTLTVTKVAEMGSEDYRSVVVRGNYAYCTASQNGFIIVDISDPANPFVKGRCSTGAKARAVVLSGNYAYVACQYQFLWVKDLVLDIIDISNPASPTRLSSATNTTGWGEDIDVYGKYAVVAADSGGLHIYDMSDTSGPVWVANFDTREDTEGVTVYGNYAYVPIGTDGLQVVDISDPADPVEVAFQQTGHDAEDAAISGNYLYLADGEAGLRILNISNPTAPALTGTCDTPEHARAVAAAGKYAYIADDAGGLQIIDISNPAAPTIAGSYNDETTYGSEIDVSGGYIYMTDKVYNKLHIFSLAGSSAPPFGDFETPDTTDPISGSVAVTGWALDDVEVDNVKIYREQGGSPVYIGDAVFVDGARPDIETAYPGYPLNSRAGWGYMLLTNFLPNGGNGTFTLLAEASDAEGKTVTLGTKTITCDNANAVKPFGAIDTPTQGGEASGTDFSNVGWVLTPMPNSIPEDGSTINVYIDGVNKGHPTYNIYRSDIAGLFPGYANQDGAAGSFKIDTTKYADGVHTIYWTAEDSAGNSDGIGSRYFSIQNTSNRRGNPMWLPDSESRLPKNYSAPVMVKTGYDPKTDPNEYYPDPGGFINIETRQMERIEINDLPPSCRGYQLVGDQLRPLPIGSTLDAAAGAFYWIPGPGFIGQYHLVFFERGETGSGNRRDISVFIRPGN